MLAFIKPGMGELLVVLLIVLLLFGAKRLPEIGSSVGHAIRGFRKSMKDLDGDQKNDEQNDQNQNTSAK